jgi:lipoate synthase
LRGSKVDILTLGQYLRPSPKHLPIVRYVPPAEFDEFRRAGYAMGFGHVESGPLVRSSYHASDHATHHITHHAPHSTTDHTPHQASHAAAGEPRLC